MAQTSYPGHRVSHGGDLTFAALFRGTYNLYSIYEKYKPLKNESEASSFYYFFPAVFALVCFSRARCAAASGRWDGSCPATSWSC